MFAFLKTKPISPDSTFQAAHYGVAKLKESAQIITFPVPKLLNAPDIAPAQYEDVAARLGFEPAELVRDRLVRFFVAAEIPIFSWKSVDDWLMPKVREKNLKHWCYRPLRKKDRIKAYRWGFKPDGDPSNNGYYSSGKWECRPYARLIPDRVLDRVAKVDEKFGDSVKFFITDYAAPDVDPFVMARPAACDDGDHGYKFIFDVWGEPGFTG